MIGKPLVITSSNRKGGCSKTSSIYHLAGFISHRNLRTLALDLDPQGSLTQSFFSSRDFEQLPDSRAATALFDDRVNASPDDLIHSTPFSNLSVVPASPGLTNFNHSNPADQGWLQACVQQFVLEVRDRFDCVLIDTPPNLQLLSFAAMVASDYVITPVIPEDYAAQGLVSVRRFIEDVQSARNPDLRWMGLLLTMVQRIALHQTYGQAIRDAYRDLVFTTELPQAAAFKEAVAARIPITIHKPGNAAAKAVGGLAGEIFARAAMTLPEPQKAPRKKPAVKKKEAA